jgi:hypothetical protein
MLWFLSVVSAVASATHQCLPVVLLESFLSGSNRMIFPEGECEWQYHCLVLYQCSAGSFDV